MTKSDAARDSEWQWMATNGNEWQRVVILANFLFLRIREESAIAHPQENVLNI